MSKFKNMIKQDMIKCNELMKSGVAKESDVKYLDQHLRILLWG